MTSCPSILATDLDGTLIPLDNNEQNQADLKTLTSELLRHEVTLLYSTGRHLASVRQAMERYGLPRPQWVICDVGTSIYQYLPAGQFNMVEAYQQHQADIIENLPVTELKEKLLKFRQLRLQEREKQGRFKLSYYVDASELPVLKNEVTAMLRELQAPYTLIDSVDPFNGDGLLDFLPASVSKAYALAWWSQQHEYSVDQIVFAGDSGNDLAALTADYRAIVVGNASQEVVEQAKAAHFRSQKTDRLFIATKPATSGVLQGCHNFGLFDATR